MLPTAAAMWQYLADTYKTATASRQYEIEVELASLYKGIMDVTSYYNAARNLWTEQDLVMLSLLSTAGLAEVRREREKIRLMQFLMRLNREFEPIRASLLNRENLKAEGVRSALIQEETRLRTQAAIDIRPGTGDGAAVFSATHSSPPQASSGGGSHHSSTSRDQAKQLGDSAYAAYKPSFQRRVSAADVECFHFHEKGHTKKYCKKRNFCHYCKKAGHIILACPALEGRFREEEGRGNGRSREDEGRGNGAASRGGSSAPRSAYAAQVIGDASGSQGMLVTPAALEQMVNTAISTAFASLQASGKIPHWILDSACFNHMTGDSSTLEKLRPLNDLSFQVANGEKLSVAGMCTVHNSNVVLPSTYHVPKLVPSLVSVGQLTD
ncbi:unnamed protein product [Linum trigynum]|uniref:Retrovirus-related Pol polyprotein from transposon TNT 1-94-like beta-barrel domain-containing protein n=1 Tax=Linum trigynum TaxID=586398 RepID=A0AAV2FQI3_9ROSI